MNVLVIIPAYNEEKSLGRVVEHLTAVCPQYDYVIVNDGSTDGTEALCRRRGYHIISFPKNQGLTSAIQAGMKYALEQNYDAALQFDADGQHLPEYIEGMVERMESAQCDIVIASRFQGGKMPLRMRTLGGKIISSAIHLTTGTHLTDPTSGMRLYRRNIVRLFAEDLHHAPEPDTIAYLIRMGAKVEEVKVEMAERKEGQSYLTPFNAAKYMTKVLSSILVLQWFRKKTSIDEPSDSRAKAAVQ